MKKMIALCGLNCGTCPCYTAWRDDNQAKREKIAKSWSKKYGTPLTAEQINCVGCLAEGIHFRHCEKCEVRKCGTTKKLTNCGLCEDYADCRTIQSLHKEIPEGKKNCEEIRAEIK